MQRKFAFVFINSTFHLLCTAIAVLVFSSPTQAAPHKKEMVVVVDPGHGGKMSIGAKGAFSIEKDIVLSVAKKVGALVTKNYPDIELVYTRTIDTFIDLEARGAIANKVGADLFISIHANATSNKGAIGTETWVMGLDKTDKNMNVAMTENAEIVYEDGYETKYEGYDPNSPESFIMFSFMQNAHMGQSLDVAAMLEKEFTNRANRKSRGVQQGPFLVLWKTTMPSVLTEIGFISNSEEEKYMNSEKGQNEIAESIASAIGEYKKRWERTHNVSSQRSAANATPAKLPEVAARKPEGTTGAVVKPSTGNTKTSETKKPATPENKTTYHVQIFSTSRILKDNAPEFKGLKNVEYYRYGNSCRYFVGSCPNDKEATKLLRDVKTKFPDAFIIKLRNGKPE